MFGMPPGPGGLNGLRSRRSFATSAAEMKMLDFVNAGILNAIKKKKERKKKEHLKILLKLSETSMRNVHNRTINGLEQTGMRATSLRRCGE